MDKDIMIYSGDSFGYGRHVGNDPMTIDQVVSELRLSEVTVEPVYLSDGSVVNGYQATRRNGHTYGVVGAGFTPVQDNTLLDLLRYFATQGEVEIVAAGSFDYGARIWVQARIGKVDIFSGDRVDHYVMLCHGHDGSWSVKYLAGLRKRLICNNQVNSALRTGINFLSFKHTRNVDFRIEEMREVLLASRAYHAELDEYEQALSLAPMSENQWNDFTVQLIPDPAPKVRKNAVLNEDGTPALPEKSNNTRALNNRNQLTELLHTGQGQELITPNGRPVSATLWGARNAVSEYVNYHKGTRKTNGSTEEMRRFDSALFGAGATMVQTADNILERMLRAA